MSNPSIVPPPAPEEPVWVTTLFRNSGYVRLWRAVVLIFLVVGLLGGLDRAWVTASEIEARYTWPRAHGKIVSASQRDDKDDFSLKSGSLSQHTQYWVEYEVEFAVPEGQCMTGIIYSGPSETMPCHGIIRTRRTQSTQQAFQWIYAGYGVNAPITVLHNPRGPQVKIAGSSIWIFYAWPETVGILIWVIGFGIFHAFLQRRLEYFCSHPEAEITPPDNTPEKDELTSLDLS